MKNIKEFILEGHDYWDCKYISKEDFMKFAKQALKDSKTDPSDIMDELGQYEDPDDLDKAYEQGELSNYIAWENAVTELISNNDKYSGKEGDIMEYVYAIAYDVLNELDK